MFHSLSRRRVIALVVLTCLLLITLDKRGNPVIDRARGVFATVLTPFDTAARAISMPVERAWKGVTKYGNVQRENQALRDQIEHLKGNDAEAQSAVLEYRELLKTVQLASKFQYPWVAAQVVGDSPSNFQNTVEINVGSLAGVAVGMPVTDGAGLVGRITKVFPGRSIVLLVTDPEYAIKAQVLSTPDQLKPTTPTGVTTPSGLPVGGLPTTTSTTTTLPTTTTTQPGAVPGSNPPSTGDSTTTTGVAAATTTTAPLKVVRETGMLQGQGADQPCVLRFIDTSSSVTSVKVGAIVDTAGGNDGLAPQGIPIGRITRIQRQAGSSSSLIEVTPNASLNRLNFVVVVRYVPNSDAVGP
ncbi:MAG: rod shape-determining protein MreC [Actinomycetota bacterium]